MRISPGDSMRGLAPRRGLADAANDRSAVTDAHWIQEKQQ
ncbi:hypothetical protein GLA29479_3685 [Lysobacter antibioticus]|nr:hypothetical protein GLA29479_3685 [Lysobacter antibioticus]